MTYKHKTHAVDSDGKITSNADVDFYIDDVSLFPIFSRMILFSLKLFLFQTLFGNAIRFSWPYCFLRFSVELFFFFK